MEMKSEAVVAVNAKNNKNVNVDEVAVKKRRGGVRLLKVALFMIRRRSEKSKSVNMASRGLWKRLVGSMRPLHLQGNTPPAIELEPNMTPRTERYEDVQFGPVSPRGAASSSSSVDSMSRYASAVNLQELDPTNGDEDNEENGDDMIDAKAEQFIAQFYEQIKLQRMDSADRRYNEMIQRSIG